MTETSISLLSILCSIVGAVMTGFLFKKYSLGFTGNAIAGVFGGTLLIKSVGRFGIDPVSIMESGSVNGWLLGVNVTISFLGGFLTIFLASRARALLLSN